MIPVQRGPTEPPSVEPEPEASIYQHSGSENLKQNVGADQESDWYFGPCPPGNERMGSNNLMLEAELEEYMQEHQTRVVVGEDSEGGQA